MVRAPVAEPLVVGVKAMLTVAVWPGLREAGTSELAMEKPAPERVTELMVTAAVPVELRVTVWVAVVLRSTLPKATEAAETLSVEVPGARLMAKVFEVELAVAVMVAVVLEATAATVAVKLAEVLPAAMVTEAGTETDEELLEIATARPPVGAAAERVTVQGSEPAAV